MICIDIIYYSRAKLVNVHLSQCNVLHIGVGDAVFLFLKSHLHTVHFEFIILFDNESYSSHRKTFIIGGCLSGDSCSLR